MEILTFGHRSKNARLTAAAALCLAACTLLALPAAANNIQVANTVVSAPAVPGDAAKISFDISWENSWRYTNLTDEAYYHDAAWVFFKVATEGEGIWRHAVLSAAGTDPSGFDKGTAGADIEMIVPSDRRGVFIRRSLANEGHGILASTNVTVLWHPVESGISSNATACVRTMAIEMVYVAEGEFWAGDGVTGFITPTRINTADATNPPVSLGGGEYEGGYPANNGNLVTLMPSTNAWPNGYNAFYLMKYQATQRQYLDFLNSLTPLQFTVNGRALREGSNHLLTSGAWPNLASTTPYRVLSKANWYNVASYLDWAALRPYTELEFEKACRGPQMYVGGEYAWGTTTMTNLTSHTGTLGSGTEMPVPDTANVMSYVDTFTRVGIFATPDSDRQKSGAGYWGNLDLSGNVFERIITIGYATGRAFSGKHGDGMLTVGGHADVEDWPEYYLIDSNAAPQGPQRRGGGGKSTANDRLRTSDRGYAANLHPVGTVDSGIRGARTAP